MGHERVWRSHAHRLRKRVKNKLPFLVEEQDGKCCYCGQEIVCERKYPDGETIVLDKWVYLKRERKMVKRASVEHIKPIFYGGGNRHDNLAAACVQCNQGRSDIERVRDVEMQRRVMFVYDECVRQFRNRPIMQMKNRIYV